METESYTDTSCHTCFESDSKFSIVSIMLGMTVCFSTLWRFPYQTANFGGAAFIAIYLIIAALFVYPALTAEWGLGRLTGRGPDGAYNNVNFPGSKYVSILLFGVVLAIGSYFAIWIGWILRYAYSAITDPSLVQSATNSAAYFDTEVAASPAFQMLFAALVVLLVAPIVVKGQQRIQKVSNAIVPVFYISVVAMTAFILAQPGVFGETMGYLTSIDIATQVTPYTFVTALGQAFFSLCLGGTFMVLYGSYMDRKKEHNIPINAGLTVFGNSLASIISIFLIVGIVSFAGITGSISQFGPGLFFGVIPEAFQALNNGSNTILIQIGMFVFFVMFFFAAYLPMTAIIEVTTVGLVDQFNWSRTKSYIVIATTTLVLAIPSAMSPHSGGFLYNLDLFVGATGLVIGSVLAIIAFTWYIPKQTVLSEVNEGSRFKLGNLWYFWTKYVTPVFMLLILLYVLSDVLARATSGLYDVNSTDYILYSDIVRIIPYTAIILITISLGLFMRDRKSLTTEKVTA